MPMGEKTKLLWENPEYRKHMSEVHMRHKPPKTAFKKGQIPWNKGKRGKYIHCTGYVMTYNPEHPFANRGYIPEHRLIIEKQISRYLTPKEIVHHVNEIRFDNRLENLMVFKSRGYHLCFHKVGYCSPIEIIFDGRKLKHKSSF